LAHQLDGKIEGFMRLGVANGRFNIFDTFASAGMKFTGWIPGRDADQFGIAVAGAFTSDPYRALTGAGTSELAFEASYRTQIAPWLVVQPNIHYIRRPAADPTIGDALVVGLRSEVSFGF
jgi:porin